MGRKRKSGESEDQSVGLRAPHPPSEPPPRVTVVLVKRLSRSAGNVIGTLGRFLDLEAVLGAALGGFSEGVREAWQHGWRIPDSDSH